MSKKYQGDYYTAAIDHFPGKTPCECGACNWSGKYSKLEPIEECVLTPGDPSPAGRCPDCDSLAYVVTPAELYVPSAEASTASGDPQTSHSAALVEIGNLRRDAKTKESYLAYANWRIADLKRQRDEVLG